MEISEYVRISKVLEHMGERNIERVEARINFPTRFLRPEVLPGGARLTIDELINLHAENLGVEVQPRGIDSYQRRTDKPLLIPVPGFNLHNYSLDLPFEQFSNLITGLFIPRGQQPPYYIEGFAGESSWIYEAPVLRSIAPGEFEPRYLLPEKAIKNR